MAMPGGDLDEQRGLDLAREAAVDTLRNEIRDGNAEVAELFAGFGLDTLVAVLVQTVYWMNSLGTYASWLRERAPQQVEAAVGGQHDRGLGPWRRRR